MFPSKSRAFARAALLAAVLAAAVPAAHAQPQQPQQPDGAGNVVRYTGCASGLALSNTFTQAWAALLVCAKIVSDEWNRTF